MNGTGGGVVLVSAPFASAVRPALGISTLCAALQRDGVPVEVLYENVRFARTIGIEVAEHIASEVPTHLLIGEWVFADVAFGTPEDEEYLGRIEHCVDGGRERLRALRRHAEAFVEEAAAEIARRAPRIVGFSTTFQQNVASLAIAAAVRRLLPDALICFGGANCEGPMGRALLRNFPQIDAVFSGESDVTFPEFVRRFYAGELLARDCAGALRGEAVRTNVVAEPIKDLDTLPVPNFDHYFAALAANELRERIICSLTVETSRGCWWGERKHCRFCGLNGTSMAYRAKSGERVRAEVAELAERYGIRRFMVTDNILHLKHVETVFDHFAASGAPYRFFYEIKANMSEQHMKRLRKGGVTTVQPGIESLDDETLQLLEKGVSALQNVRLLRVCAELGMVVAWNLLAGIPDEPDAAYRRMLERMQLIEHLPPPNGCSPIRVDRFSPYFDRAEELGFSDVRPASAYRRVYDLPDEELRDLAYFFDGTPRNAASIPYVDELRTLIGAWRDRHYEDHEPPVLAVVEIGAISLVRDTRRCAVSPMRVLSQAEADMLRSLRDVTPINRALATPREYSGEEPSALFERLCAWKYVMTDGNRAVSLVTDFAERDVDSDYVVDSLREVVKLPETVQ